MEKYKESGFKEDQVVYIIKEIAYGVQALNNLNPPLIHRDLKLENILLHQKRFKLCDFGACSSLIVPLNENFKEK